MCASFFLFYALIILYPYVQMGHFSGRVFQGLWHYSATVTAHCMLHTTWCTLNTAKYTLHNKHSTQQNTPSIINTQHCNSIVYKLFFPIVCRDYLLQLPSRPHISMQHLKRKKYFSVKNCVSTVCTVLYCNELHWIDVIAASIRIEPYLCKYHVSTM